MAAARERAESRPFHPSRQAALSPVPCVLFSPMLCCAFLPGAVRAFLPGVRAAPQPASPRVFSPAELLLEREPEPEFGCCALVAAGRRLEGGSRLGRSSSLSGRGGEGGPWVPLTRVSPRLVCRHRAARHRHHGYDSRLAHTSFTGIALHWQGKQTKTVTRRNIQKNTHINVTLKAYREIKPK